jgi:hypothetical protein
MSKSRKGEQSAIDVLGVMDMKGDGHEGTLRLRYPKRYGRDIDGRDMDGYLASMPLLVKLQQYICVFYANEQQPTLTVKLPNQC